MITMSVTKENLFSIFAGGLLGMLHCFSIAVPEFANSLLTSTGPILATALLTLVLAYLLIAIGLLPSNRVFGKHLAFLKEYVLGGLNASVWALAGLAVVVVSCWLTTGSLLAFASAALIAVIVPPLIWISFGLFSLSKIYSR